MKNLSLVLNIILIIAVMALFYLHFSSPKVTTADVTSDTADTSKARAPKVVAKNAKIYYVNTDTITANYQLVQDLQKDLNRKRQSLQATYEAKARKFQEEGMKYEQQLNENTISVDQAKKVEDDLRKQQTDLINMEKNLESLGAEFEGKQTQIKQEIDAFMAEYKKGKSIDYILGYTSLITTIVYANDSLDITAEVLEGLNARYKAKDNTSKSK